MYKSLNVALHHRNAYIVSDTRIPKNVGVFLFVCFCSAQVWAHPPLYILKSNKMRNKETIFSSLKNYIKLNQKLHHFSTLKRNEDLLQI